MIFVEHLTRSYGRHRGVSDVSFRLEPGQVTGILGPNGAGKSTTIKVLTTHLLPTSGRVEIFGHDARRDPLAVRALLGYLPEQSPLYNDMRVDDFLRMVGQLHGLDSGQLKVALDRVIGQCGLEDVIHRPIDQISRGYRQRTGLAQALIHNPRFLVLDEPTSGLDPNQVVEMRELIREIGRHNTVLFSSHILSEVEALCDRVLILDQGRLVADAAPADLRRTNTVRVTVRGARASLAAALTAFGNHTLLAEEAGTCQAEVEASDSAARERLVLHLIERGLPPFEIGAGTHELETVFAQLTRGSR